MDCPHLLSSCFQSGIYIVKIKRRVQFVLLSVLVCGFHSGCKPAATTAPAISETFPFFTKSGVEMTFLAGGEFPIPIVQNGVSSSITIEYKEFGADRHRRSIDEAQDGVATLVEKLVTAM